MNSILFQCLLCCRHNGGPCVCAYWPGCWAVPSMQAVWTRCSEQRIWLPARRNQQREDRKTGKKNANFANCSYSIVTTWTVRQINNSVSLESHLNEVNWVFSCFSAVWSWLFLHKAICARILNKLFYLQGCLGCLIGGSRKTLPQNIMVELTFFLVGFSSVRIYRIPLMMNYEGTRKKTASVINPLNIFNFYRTALVKPNHNQQLPLKCVKQLQCLAWVFTTTGIFQLLLPCKLELKLFFVGFVSFDRQEMPTTLKV